MKCPLSAKAIYTVSKTLLGEQTSELVSYRWVQQYLENVFQILISYTITVNLKESHQDVIKVQTFCFE